MNSIEEKLWNYIDGTCTADEQKTIDLLIEQDEAYRSKYHELLQLSQEFAAIELDEPPMAFTYNVMENIRAQNAQVPLKAAINKGIIRFISGFFVLTILGLLVIAATNMHWYAGNAVAPHITLPNISHYFSGSFMQGFMFFDLVLALYLFDTYLRKRAFRKHNTTVLTGGQEKRQPN
jgi:hypothetical protein